MRKRFEEALPFADYLKTVQKNEELWHGVYERAEISEDAAEVAAQIPGTWHLLALSEDWCGDATNIIPVVERLAEASPNLDLRILSRDENPDIMDAHLTGGTSRSIPVIMILDEDYRERAWWGPRPSELQAWVMNEGLQMESGPRYKETRRYYARDKGQTTVREILELIGSVAGD